MFPENRMMEVLIIGALALIVVGPKDLPVLMRRVGQFVGKMRGMAAEFRASFDELARQSELEDLRKEVEALRSQSPLAHVNPLKDEHLAATFNEIHDGLATHMTPLSAVPAPDAGPQAEAPAVAEAKHVTVDPSAKPSSSAPAADAP
jgi:sec-independent protein translocase protein TatB